jgi:hypothetical protein
MFFNIYMKAFIKRLLGYDPKALSPNLEGEILDIVKGYYGCVETQDHGSLHCHMLVWVEGGLSPDNIKKKLLNSEDTLFQERLLAFLDDTISNCVPHDPDASMNISASRFHPCSVRGPEQ